MKEAHQVKFICSINANICPFTILTSHGSINILWVVFFPISRSIFHIHFIKTKTTKSISIISKPQPIIISPIKIQFAREFSMARAQNYQSCKNKLYNK